MYGQWRGNKADFQGEKKEEEGWGITTWCCVDVSMFVFIGRVGNTGRF